ncbi:MAG: hypothetical protein ABSG76_20330, partial [Xanthobacteraceae bacterium]
MVDMGDDRDIPERHSGSLGVKSGPFRPAESLRRNIDRIGGAQAKPVDSDLQAELPSPLPESAQAQRVETDEAGGVALV